MKKVLITGAASGIGFELTKKFLLNGDMVFMVDYNKLALKKAFDKIISEAKPLVKNLYYYECDVRMPSHIWRIIEYVKDIGDLDVLINNAGIAHNEELINTDNSSWAKLIDTNLLGPIYMMNIFMPMLKRTKGQIVNVSSGQAFFRLPSWGAYSVTKLALGALSELLSFEASKYNIKVTTVYPFMVNTPFYEDMSGDTFVSKLAMKFLPLYSDSAEKVAQKIFQAVQKKKRVEYINPINYVGVAFRAMPPVAGLVTYIADKLLNGRVR